jgi:hypothetical protein
MRESPVPAQTMIKPGTWSARSATPLPLQLGMRSWLKRANQHPGLARGAPDSPGGGSYWYTARPRTGHSIRKSLH